jgi:hypothetical protein
MTNNEAPFARLLRQLADFIDNGTKAPATVGAKLCAIASEYVNSVSRFESVATFNAAQAALESLDVTLGMRESSDGVAAVSDDGGPIPATPPRRKR